MDTNLIKSKVQKAISCLKEYESEHYFEIKQYGSKAVEARGILEDALKLLKG